MTPEGPVWRRCELLLARTVRSNLQYEAAIEIGAKGGGGPVPTRSVLKKVIRILF